MRRTISATLIAALVLTAFAVSGCSLFTSPTDEANAAIAEANTHLKKYQDSDTKVQGLAAQLNKLNVSPEGAAKALDLVAQVQSELQGQKTELEAAATAIAKVKTFEVDATFKKYADLEVAAIRAKIAVVDEGVKLYTEEARLYTAIRDKQATAQLTSEITTNLDEMFAKVTSLTETATKAAAEAESYFSKAAGSK